MLKWAVNGNNKTSYLEDVRTSITADHSQQSIPKKSDSKPRRRLLSTKSEACLIVRRERLRRKSSGHELSTLHRKVLYRDKENNLTSTPLPKFITKSTSPLRKLDSLKDLSNITITPDKNSIIPSSTSNDTYFPEISETSSPLLSSAQKDHNPNQYATTLPTFDVEYSPCGPVPGPILALRGLGIADSYFEKPRYLTDEKSIIPKKRLKTDDSTPSLSTRLSDLDFSNFRHPTTCIKASNNHQNLQQRQDSSLSSSRMGDIALDRMIDAILESARKDRRHTKSTKQNSTCASIMSPTYTPAEDPASDLNEFWDPRTAKYLQSDHDHGGFHTNRINDDQNLNTVRNICYGINEREVRTPEYLMNYEKNYPSSDIIKSSSSTVTNSNISCHLKRQRAVRRKRKSILNSKNFLTTTVKNSAQKLFKNNSLLRKSYDELVKLDTPKGYPNISPDSGRNSASDFEESAEDTNYTKRRLSFSPAKLKNIDLPMEFATTAVDI